ncbi:HD domain-containing protein [Winogradskyella undariae]|uniref:HD domain-containing protein n=1 Tax=Winogradskyella undariae TaxID=1285465 RepID=UPI0020C3AA3D|nr:hypothetical protein [Winogradskyella undariae]
MNHWLENEWNKLVLNYTDNSLAKIMWKDIENHYNSKSRHYHNLSHLYNMLLQLEDFKNDIEDLNAVKFAIWYHDIIYKSTHKDNEEQSANYCEKGLKTLKIDDFKIEKIKTLIISTKKHQLALNKNTDNAYLLDLDLSILRSDWETYKSYTESIRKEYAIYPDILYKPGRKKVLKQFLERDSLYFTDRFKTKFEKQAIENLKQEIELL